MEKVQKPSNSVSPYEGFKLYNRESTFYLDVTCAVESVVPELSQALGIKFRWKVRSVL
jgi:hypothetical protein